MKRRGWLAGLLLLGCGLFVASLWAADGLRAGSPPTQDAVKSDSDLDAVKAAADKYTSAFNAKDAAALAGLFTNDAEFVDGSNTVVHGKKAIEEAFAQYFKDHAQGKLTVDMDLVRRIGPTALVEEGTYQFEGDNGKPSGDRSHYVMLHVKQNDGWKIASIRCERATTTSPAEQLRQLDWLVGSWVDEGSDEVIKSTWKWSEDGNFILGDFSVEARGRLVIKGTQRIGWDGSRKQIRSWVFDAAGGFVEGYWNKTASGQWVVKTRGVNSEGERTSQTTVYEPRGKDSFLLTLRDRMEGNQSDPDVTVTIVRAGPTPKN